MQQFDHSKLLGLMREKGFSQDRLAKETGISKTALSNKIHNKSEFTATEMLTIIVLLGIEDPRPYFFTQKVAI